MKIVADRYLPGVIDAFNGAAEVVLSEPDAIENRTLHDCDVLLVRTVTPVNESLLRDTPVSFVGTATSGTDHIDTGYLAEHGIAFAHAPGSNARPVAEYVLSALAVLCEHSGSRLTDHSVGIVGCGHVGSQLADLLDCLGVETLLNDPPLAEQGEPTGFRDLATVLQADVVTLHVPLSAGGEYPTVNLLDADRLMQMKTGSWLINTARGGVIDEAALKHAIAVRGLQVVLDVWRDEPAIDTQLAAAVKLGTPHIAGYSQAAKLRATAMVCQAVYDHFGLCAGPAPGANEFTDTRVLPLADTDFEEQVRLAVLNSYDVRGDAAALERLLRLPAAEQTAYFTALRHDYRLRQEFSSLLLELHGAAATMAEGFQRLGFRVSASQRQTSKDQ